MYQALYDFDDSLFSQLAKSRVSKEMHILVFQCLHVGLQDGRSSRRIKVCSQCSRCNKYISLRNSKQVSLQHGPDTGFVITGWGQPIDLVGYSHMVG